jgi:chromosomal replication initiator protein
MDVVGTLQLILAERIGRERFDLWFGKLARLEANGGDVRVVSGSPFVRDWIRKNFDRVLRDALQAALDKAGDVCVQYTLMDSSAASASTSSGDRPAAPAAVTGARHPAATPRAVSQSDKPQTAFRTRTFESFESFVVGEENGAAMTAARLAAERPGQASPLLIYGPTATGKTHLLEGIRTAVRANQPQLRVLCLTAEQFTSGYVEAAQRRELPSFRGKYRFVDCLLLDDVHFLAGKTGTVGELLQTVDALGRAGKQVVLTADRPPAELGPLGEELLSRISAGLVTDIRLPGYDVRLGIARRAAESIGFHVASDILAALAMQVSSHSRAVIGAVNRLYAHSLTSGTPLTRDQADVLLATIAQQNAPCVRLPDIERAVCDLFGIDGKSLRSARRGRTVSDPRVLAMWLARKYTRAALGEIGNFFGRRSHSTVITAGRKVERWLESRAHIAVGNHNCTADEAIRRIEQALRRA